MSARRGILAKMSVDSAELFASMLAMVALVGGVAHAGGSLLPANAVGSVSKSVHDVSLWLAWLVATVATAGSLYFSEIADYVPCRLCWFQRICMFPLAGILLVAAIRRDRNVRWYALPFLIAGIAVSSYHYIIEWRPSWGEGACSVGPACTDVWFRRLGFVTLSFMALCGFLSIVALLFVHPKSENLGTTIDD